MEIKVYNPKNGKTVVIFGQVQTAKSNSMHTAIKLAKGYGILNIGATKWVNTSWIIK